VGHLQVDLKLGKNGKETDAVHRITADAFADQ
jgi:hypothetical protein